MYVKPIAICVAVCALLFDVSLAENVPKQCRLVASKKLPACASTVTTFKTMTVAGVTSTSTATTTVIEIKTAAVVTDLVTETKTETKFVTATTSTSSITKVVSTEVITATNTVTMGGDVTGHLIQDTLPGARFRGSLFKRDELEQDEPDTQTCTYLTHTELVTVTAEEVIAYKTITSTENAVTTPHTTSSTILTTHITHTETITETATVTESSTIKSTTYIATVTAYALCNPRNFADGINDQAFAGTSAPGLQTTIETEESSAFGSPMKCCEAAAKDPLSQVFKYFHNTKKCYINRHRKGICEARDVPWTVELGVFKSTSASPAFIVGVGNCGKVSLTTSYQF